MLKSNKVSMLEDDERQDDATYIKQHDKSSSFRLAIISLVLFISAMAFLCLFLITPIMYSLNHPETKPVANQSQDEMAMAASSSSHEGMPEMSEHSHDGMVHHHDRRDVSVEQNKISVDSELNVSLREHVEVHNVYYECLLQHVEVHNDYYKCALQHELVVVHNVYDKCLLQLSGKLYLLSVHR